MNCICVFVWLFTTRIDSLICLFTIPHSLADLLPGSHSTRSPTSPPPDHATLPSFRAPLDADTFRAARHSPFPSCRVPISFQPDELARTGSSRALAVLREGQADPENGTAAKQGARAPPSAEELCEMDDDVLHTEFYLTKPQEGSLKAPSRATVITGRPDMNDIFSRMGESRCLPCLDVDDIFSRVGESVRVTVWHQGHSVPGTFQRVLVEEH